MALASPSLEAEDHPFLTAARALVAAHVSLADKPRPRALDEAHFQMADIVAAVYRQGFDIKTLQLAFEKMTAVRRRKLNVHEIRRVWSYMPSHQFRHPE